MKERVQKILARAGHGSRRHIEEWIRDGRITINGRIAALGDTASERDIIAIDGSVLNTQITEKTRVLVYHKLINEVCSRSDPEGRPTVFENLPRLLSGRWINVGRLDFNTTGLLLFTNDGELAHKLMHPSSNIEREYAVRIFGNVEPEVLQRLQKGVTLEDGVGRFDKIIEKEAQGMNRWFHVVVKEGKNRLVRRLWESQGFTVSRLIRVRYGCVTLERSIRPGKTKELTGKELQELFDLVDYQPALKLDTKFKKMRSHHKNFKKQRRNNR